MALLSSSWSWTTTIEDHRADFKALVAMQTWCLGSVPEVNFVSIMGLMNPDNEPKFRMRLVRCIISSTDYFKYSGHSCSETKEFLASNENPIGIYSSSVTICSLFSDFIRRVCEILVAQVCRNFQGWSYCSVTDFFYLCFPYALKSHSRAGICVIGCGSTVAILSRGWSYTTAGGLFSGYSLWCCPSLWGCITISTQTNSWNFIRAGMLLFNIFHHMSKEYLCITGLCHSQSEKLYQIWKYSNHV